MVKLENTKNLVHVQHYISTFIDSIGNKILYEYLLDFGTPYIKRVSTEGDHFSQIHTIILIFRKMKKILY